MIPYLLAVAGGYFIGNSMNETSKFNKGGKMKDTMKADLEDYVKDASKRCFAGGGNGENLLQYGLPEVASMIDSNTLGITPEEGWYSQSTMDAFKKLVDAMVKDEIENNNVNYYAGTQFGKD
jgi:hypothetical protein